MREPYVDATLTQGERVIFALADPDDEPLPAVTREGIWLDDGRIYRVDPKQGIIGELEPGGIFTWNHRGHMRDHAVTYLPWLLSVITIYMTVLAGNKHPSAWLIGLINQALWLGWILASSAYGLLPMNIALWAVYGRNHWKWNTQVPVEPKTYLACPDCNGSVLWAGRYNKCYDCGKGIC